MKKIIIILHFLLVMKINAQESNSLRYFMQPQKAISSAIPYGNNLVAGRYIKSDDANIYYEVYGKGKPVLVLHGGIFGSTYEMGQFIDSLKINYQVIAVSTRGHGKSELGKIPLSYEQRAKDANTTLNAVTQDSVIVLGFSDGGFTAYKLAELFPEKVRKMIIIGASEIFPGMRNVKVNLKDALAFDKEYINQQLLLMPEPDRLQEMFDKVAASVNNLTIGKEVLSRINVPTLIVAGENDANNNPQHTINTVKMLPKGHLSIIPFASHGVFLENFQAVWSIVKPFINHEKD
jgi:pimeloyl-ACP methyl ester carboxylesterase